MQPCLSVGLGRVSSIDYPNRLEEEKSQCSPLNAARQLGLGSEDNWISRSFRRLLNGQNIPRNGRHEGEDDHLAISKPRRQGNRRRGPWPRSGYMGLSAPLRSRGRILRISEAIDLVSLGAKWGQGPAEVRSGQSSLSHTARPPLAPSALDLEAAGVGPPKRITRHGDLVGKSSTLSTRPYRMYVQRAVGSVV
ncbi:hypothetical protein SODALDRAFT_143807 [Sodiomyces alkalinus F11]|uniref:Uncharacterized protein n=1 Tax=Sodiomyces alkalinus (strain CBS 110278 / VKM F-3762 / F11) TaxID=1314773 RepID=A0A3N2PZU5_SODAK|nr:hypothetical protein SODALDRAFT_143807 [Sodiomyces alkalinus F11]ROT40023.1 hypothetical protein SODALDRAFT_143807 [Sodiomyces alkalinus F11]